MWYFWLNLAKKIVVPDVNALSKGNFLAKEINLHAMCEEREIGKEDNKR
jgi:hypothetical protein